ncbi:MAG: substrate-binding domain-containing protein [Reinekea sp.]|nr:substrate-binding domain-containing protein [Reinekea sp.]
MAKKKNRPTLQHVADEVGITKMTVSRFLRNPESVSASLQTRIAKALEDIGYIHNQAPNLLSNAKSHAIGVLVPSLTNQVFAEVIRGIEEVIDPAGYQTMLAHYGYSKNAEEARLAKLLSYNIDGVILSESVHTERTRKMLDMADIPVVEIMDSVAKPISQAVGIDNAAASTAMTQRMIEKGYRNLVYLAARMDERTQQKIQGYKYAMNAAKLTAHVIHTELPSSFTIGSELLCQALKEHPNMDGVVCTNDDIAIGALYECQRQNIPVPGKIAIAGFHGHNFSQVIVPKLATVATPREDIGRLAATELLARFNGEPMEKNVFELPFKVLDGETI